MHNIKPSILSSVVTTAVRVDRVVSVAVAADGAYNNTHFILILPKKALEHLLCDLPIIKTSLTKQDLD